VPVPACLRWESEKDFIDLSGIKNQVTQEAQLRERSQRASAPQEPHQSQLSVFCFWEREREEEALHQLWLWLALTCLSLLCAEIKPF
jgi:hypothetical protein